MNISSLKNRSALSILLYLLAIALIYAVNIFPLAYNLTSWKSFGDLPIETSRLVYFVADTPNVISYRQQGATDSVTCSEAVAYLETSSGDITRCCQTEVKTVSCLSGDYVSEIQTSDETCISTMRETFGVDASLLMFAECPEGGNPEMTVTQIDAEDQITWKTLTMFELGFVNSALRCVLAPLLLGLAIRSVIIMRRKPDPKRQIQRW